MTIMKKYILPVMMTVICWSGLKAQDDVLPSRSLTIEGAYNPSMSEQGKIMPVPQRPETQRQAATVSYRTESNPSKDYGRTPMGVFGEQTDDVTPSRYYGLVRLGYGLRNVSDGLLDAGWRISDRDLLTLSGLMDGWSTKPDGQWKSRMFNSDLKMEYSHRFDSLSIGAYGAYGHSRLNFREGKDTTSAILAASDFLQKTNRAEVGLWLSGEFMKAQWHFDAGMQWLSRKGLILNGVEPDNRERLLRINAGLELPLLGGIGGAGYRQKIAMYDWQGVYGTQYGGLTTITLSPYWKKTWGDLDTRLGVNLDVRSAAGYKVLLSPMVTATYNAGDNIRLLAAVTGGVKDNCMRTLAGISPYWTEAERIRDGYELMNASVGVSYSQGTWLTLSLKGGYSHTIDELFQVVHDSLIISSMLKQEGCDVFYARLDADMQFADRAQVKMDLTCNGYTGKYSDGILAFKPVLDGSLFGRVNIMPGLDAMLTYRTMMFCKVQGTRERMVNDVALTLDYDFRPNLSFYVTGNRLTGGNYCYYAGYRAIKPSVLIGATYRF